MMDKLENFKHHFTLRSFVDHLSCETFRLSAPLLCMIISHVSTFQLNSTFFHFFISPKPWRLLQNKDDNHDKQDLVLRIVL